MTLSNPWTMPKATRGEVWDVEFDPGVGAEIRKLRPAVVMNAASIGRLPLCIVVPVTEWKAAFAACVWFTQLKPTAENGLSKDSIECAPTYKTN
jgi:mRNA interferase MazF